jgi:hypothetical protein
MYFDFRNYLLPGQRPWEWQALSPIELLPALRGCYPGCIDETVLSVQLVNEKRDIDRPSSSWCFDVMQTGDRIRQVPVVAVTDDRGDNYDFSDTPTREFPWELLERIFYIDRAVALQKALQIFKDDAFEMMKRLDEGGARQGIQELNFIEYQYQKRIDFLRDLLLHLTEHITDSVDLKSPVIANLKSENAHGLRDDSHKSRWHEVIQEVENPSLLYQQTRDDVESEVWGEFKLLPRPIKVALWFKTHADSEFQGGSQALSWDPPDKSPEKLDLFDMDGWFELVVRDVFHQAQEDADTAMLSGEIQVNLFDD